MATVFSHLDPGNVLLKNLHLKFVRYFQDELEHRTTAIEVYYDNYFYTAIPCAISAINNAMYRHYLRETGLDERSVADYGIVAASRPIVSKKRRQPNK
ncbi:unnamed protein product [Cyprideis torosa]|uniref:Uncharacterized protein n=1 Tax=Cyprideis torosa TaxID=163714 RepID=A0A7R8ZZ14_9CRUS|nr:unnamed protein product [Cyprideis torosa]CAG0909118.1 unnamed protein product [Cyprideis torosa]